MSTENYLNRFRLDEKICVITGAGGLLGRKHAEAIIQGGGVPILLDISSASLENARAVISANYPNAILDTCMVDITDKTAITDVQEYLLRKYGHIDALINNAANNPKVEEGSVNLGTYGFCDFPLGLWNDDMAVGLTGALVCAQVFGRVMENQGKGVVVNIGSDYSLIAPDQRIYRKEGLAENEQVIKPVSYSIVKHAIIGLTKYLAVYWAGKGIRVNTLCPASLYNGQDDEFVRRISALIPMGRMSDPDEYVCTVLYLLSDASSYMTGSTVILDGGRTSW